MWYPFRINLSQAISDIITNNKLQTMKWMHHSKGLEITNYALTMMHWCLLPHTKTLHQNVSTCFNHQVTTFGRKLKLNKLPSNLPCTRTSFFGERKSLHILFKDYFDNKQLNGIGSVSFFIKLSLLISVDFNKLPIISSPD